MTSHAVIFYVVAWWQFIDWLKCEGRPSSLRNSEMANNAYVLYNEIQI